MATIQKRERAKGTVYTIRVRLGDQKINTTFTPDPSWSESRTKKELNKFVVEFENKVMAGKLFDGEKITFNMYCEDWLKEKKMQLSPTTYEYYEKVINNKFVPALSGLKMADIKPKHIKDYIANVKGSNGQELSPASIKKELAVLKSIFKTAWEDQIIDTNPTERVKPPKQETNRELKHFTTEQALQFLAILDSPMIYTYKAHQRTLPSGCYNISQYTIDHTISLQYKVFFNIALTLGARKGEILALTWDDIDFKNKEITINKTVVQVKNEKAAIDKKAPKTITVSKEPKTSASIRVLPLIDDLYSLLKQYKKEWNEYRLKMGSAWNGQNNLFIQSDGALMHPSTPYHKFTEIIDYYNSNCKKEEEKLPKIPLHGLRHTTASLLIMLGIDPKTVSRILGHAQTSTTLNIYAHYFEKTTSDSLNKIGNVLYQKTI